MSDVDAFHERGSTSTRYHGICTNHFRYERVAHDWVGHVVKYYTPLSFC